MTLSDKIVQIREGKNISKADMAKALDMDFSNYHRLEGRSNKLTLEQIERIAEALSVSVVDLLTWGKEKPQGADEEKLKEKISSQQEEIAVLKDRIKDKDKIIATQSESIESFRNQVTILLEKILERWAFRNDIGIVTIERADSENFETYKLPLAEWKKQATKDGKLDTEKFWKAFYGIELTVKEKVRAVPEIIEGGLGPFKFLFWFTNDPFLTAAYIEYELNMQSRSREDDDSLLFL